MFKYMKEFTYNGKWVLINAYFYTFWMLREDFNKYKLNNK